MGAGGAARPRRTLRRAGPEPGPLRARPPAHLRSLGGVTGGARGHPQGSPRPGRLPAARSRPEERHAAHHLGAAADRRHRSASSAAAWWPRRWGATPSRSAPAWCGRGKITAEQLDRARSMQSGGDSRRLGDILVGIGAISRRELDRQLKAQIEEAVFDLLTWTEGYFRFEEGSPCQAAVEAPVRSPTEALLMEGARRLDEWSRIGSKVSHLGLVPRLPRAERRRRRSISCPSNGRCSRRWTAQRDLHALADVLGRSEFEVARTVYGLTAAGIVELGDPSTPGREPEPGRDLAALLVPAREAMSNGAVRDRRRRAGGGAPARPADARGASTARRLPGGDGPVQPGAGDLALLEPARPPQSGRRSRGAVGRAHAPRGGDADEGAGALP